MPIYPYEKKGVEHYYYAFEVKDANGKRKTIKKRGFKGKTECRNAEREARVAWEKGLFIDPSKLTFEEYMKDWLSKKQDIGEQTRYVNEGHIRNHIAPVIGHILLQKLNVVHIETLVKELQDKGLASGTVKKIFNLVNTSLSAALKKEMITKNPVSLMDSKPRVEKTEMKYWTKEEVKIFLDSLEGDRLKIIFSIAIYTGMRRGEILGLRWEDIDFEANQIRIRQVQGFLGKMKAGAKTMSGNRSISVSPSLMTEIKKHRTIIIQEKWDMQDEYEDNNLVVCQKNGKPVSWSNFDKCWKRRLKKADVRKIRFHDLRHTCASLLLSANVHPKIVQELLGHSSIKVTLDKYSHLMPNLQEDAVKELDKMLK